MNIWPQIWFQGPFYDGKNTPYCRELDFSLWNKVSANYGISPKVSAVLDFGFGIVPEP